MFLFKAAMVAMSAPALFVFSDSALATGLPKPAEKAAVSNDVTTKAAVDLAAEPATNLPALRPLSTPATAQTPQSFPAATISRQRLPLSPGDRLRVYIPGIGGEDFSGEYEVNFNGDLEIPFLEPIPVTGLTAADVQAKLTDVLLQQQFFRDGLLKVSVQILDYSPIQVSVTGEVFDPGRVLLSRESAVIGDDAGQVVELPGDNPLERYLTSALKAIGGVKPTADVSKVQVLRGTESIVVDLSGIFSGSVVNDFPLVAGDQIIVPDSGSFQAGLVRPSQITPDSIDLYVSNVTEPSTGTNLRGNDNINVASFAYGTNLTQALVAARCVGGTPSTNANRRALLIHSDRLSGGLTTSEYSVADLVSNDTQSIEDNPFVMPEDAIACFDSRTTNIRGILGTASNFLNPLNLLFNLFDR